MTTLHTAANRQEDELEGHIFSRRREFLRRALVTSAYAAPIMMSFAAQDLIRASSSPGSINDPGGNDPVGHWHWH